MEALGGAYDDITGHAARVCDRIEKLDADILAFVPEAGRRERLMAEAGSVAARWPDAAKRPALYGVAVGIKDIVRVDGLPTRAGSAIPPGELSGPQASLVDRLREAGALVAGKTVTAEFAATAPGPTHNPRKLRHTPGGSSSGSAAAVAAGMVPLAIGTQTIGSVIRPAAYCGVVGFKPSYGRIPVDGVIAYSPTFDTVGVFTADVAGAALAASVLCDGWTPPPTGPGTDRPPVLGVPIGRYLDRATDHARNAFEGHATLLEAAGFTVRRVPLMADFDRIVLEQFLIGRYELARTHADWFPRFAGLYRQQTVTSIRQGRAIDRSEYERALEGPARFREGLLGAMCGADIDLWITPAATGPAPADLSTTGDPIMCLPWSVAGLPSLTVPAPHSPSRLPLGLQCVGRPGADERLLSWAASIESVLSRAAGRT